MESERHLFTIKPDNYEYPFQLMLDGDLPESVEGLGGTHLVYRLKARVVRGKFNHDITAKKVRAAVAYHGIFQLTEW